MLEALTNSFREIENTDLAKIAGEGKLGQFQKRMLESFLRVRIRRFWRSFETSVDELIDHVECYRHGYRLGPPKPVGNKFDNTFESCDRYKPGICKVRETLKSRLTEAESMRDAIEVVRDRDAETEKRLRTLREIVRLQARRTLSRQQCWNLGDAIIALEAPPDSVIVTSNRRHYSTLCQAIGKAVCFY